MMSSPDMPGIPTFIKEFTACSRQVMASAVRAFKMLEEKTHTHRHREHQGT